MPGSPGTGANRRQTHGGVAHVSASPSAHLVGAETNDCEGLTHIVKKAISPRALRSLLTICALVLLLPVAAADAKPLERGDKGTRVAKLQRKLGLPADRIFGPATVRAVKRFQRRHGLTADGIVGRVTWRAIFRRGGSSSRPRVRSSE